MPSAATNGAFAKPWAVAVALLLSACADPIAGALAQDDALTSPRSTDASSRLDASEADAVQPDPDAGRVARDAQESLQDASPRDAGAPPPPDAGECSTESLAARLSLTRVPGMSSPAFAHPLASGGLVAAWAGAGAVTVAALDGAGMPSGAPRRIPGDGVWGLAASSDAHAVLVSRGDVLALTIISAAGTSTTETRLMGGVPHDITNNEWFGPQIRAARLDFDGRDWLAYATVQRLWPDGIAHYGDTLRTYRADGAPAQVYWSWGCSHSMEVRLTHNSAGIGPVCSSDCFPDKGIFFMHQTPVFLDASGNCAGSVAQELGGVVAAPDGFWVSFISGQGRSSKDVGLVHVGNDRRVGMVRWLTDTPENESSLHLARLGEGFVAGWVAGSSGYLLRLDASGAPAGSPEPVSAAAMRGAGDFFVFANSDVGWLVGGDLARLHACR